MDLKKRSELHWARKIWHMSTVAFMAVFYWKMPGTVSFWVLFGSWLVAVPVDLIRTKYPAFNESLVHAFRGIMRENEYKKLAGTTYLITGVLLVFIFATREIVLLTLLFLAFADPIASIVGIKFGKDKLFGHKSLQGTLAAFVVCTIITFLFLSSHNFISQQIWIVSLLAGLIGAMAELIPIANLDDNLTLPVVSATGLVALFAVFGVAL